jgi:hypothetical protein
MQSAAGIGLRVAYQAHSEKPSPIFSTPAAAFWQVGTSFVDVAILDFLLFTFMKAFQDRRAPWYLRGLIRKPLCEIGVILLHDVECRLFSEFAMVFGEHRMHSCKFFVGHGPSPRMFKSL